MYLRIEQRREIALCLAIALLGIGGCASDHANFLKTNPATHAAVLEVDEPPVIRGAPAFLIGIEKAGRSRIGRPKYKDCSAGEPYCFDTYSEYVIDDKNESSSLAWDVRKRFREFKPTFVSHIIQFQPSGDSGVDRMVLYNVYRDPPDGKKESKMILNRSWDVLVGDFQNALDQAVRQHRATHIVVISTGWNTQQLESIENYNDWVREFAAAAAAAGSPFRPIYIGLSWPSDWTSLPGGSDYWNKAHDADEIGLTWANVIANIVIPRVVSGTDADTVYIGHSFGARLLTRALHSSALITTETPSNKRQMIGLQGAFALNRFLRDEGEEGSPYWNFPFAAENFIFTTSAFDKAMDAAPTSMLGGSPFIGNDDAYRLTKDNNFEYAHMFDHAVLRENGAFEKEPNFQDSSIILIVEADKVVSKNKPGTGGGAHSDVFDAEIARFVLDSVLGAQEQ